MIDLEREKKNFQNHIATFTDYGNIKILDFKRPNSNEYRIRFLFEEDHYRLHISGDLGELIATNYKNMTYEGFSDYVDNTGYFKEKIDCMNRSLYYWDEDKAKNDLWATLEEAGIDLGMEDEVDDILWHFDIDSGLTEEGVEKLEEFAPDCWELAEEIGREETGVIELYMLAFKLAKVQIEEREKKANGKGK